MVAYVGDLTGKRKKWLDWQTFKDGVALAQSIPGATAMQTVAYVGLQAKGWGVRCYPISLNGGTSYTIQIIVER
jgi:chromate transport protein ChrA